MTLAHVHFIVNPRHACAARVTVVFLKLLSHTHQATEVKKYVGFSLKLLPSKVMALFAYLWHHTAILQRYSVQLFNGRAF